MIEPTTGQISEVIRFNPEGSAAGYLASLVFYSDFEINDALADTGFPFAFL